MSLSMIVSVLQQGIWQVFKLTAPILGSALVIGLVVAIFQAVTSIQEQTLTFLPKLIVILAVIALLGGWMFATMRLYTINLFQLIPELAK